MHVVAEGPGATLSFETFPFLMGFPGGSDGKASANSMGDLGLIPGLGRSSGKENKYPLQYSRLENPHGQRSLAGFSPRGRKVGHDSD